MRYQQPSRRISKKNFFTATSLALLLGFAPSALYLTHFGRLVDAPARGADLHRQVEAHVRLALGVELHFGVP